MPSDSPFFLTRVECPICRTVNEFETVRMGAYVEEGRDTDFCPTRITWRSARYEGYNPLVFFAAVCSNCFYARELTNTFRDWKDDQTFRTYRLKSIKEKHLDQLATADSFLKQIGAAIDVTRFPNESAILKLHLTIFDELLFEHHSKLDIGRFYLRIGWVFRSMSDSNSPRRSMLQGLLSDLDTKYRLVRSAFHDAHMHAGAFAEQVDAHFDDPNLGVEGRPDFQSHRESLHQAIRVTTEALLRTGDAIETIDTALRDYRSAAVGGENVGPGSSFAQYPSFVDFLLAVRARWDGVVTNEHEALTQAVRSYKEAFAGGRDIAPGNQQIQASYLIAELSRRIGDFDTAREYFNSTIRYGQEFIYKNRHDRTQTALARKILELAVEQGKSNKMALQTV
ncbi:MAG TPA: DUF2225 domain-containing protein [Candidatus Deferrimicrobium sp.]|nr:DUF2225 domain-containing protein [Candidatus Deferrimicrobium sp.]